MTRKVVEQKLIKHALFFLFPFINKTINTPQQYFQTFHDERVNYHINTVTFSFSFLLL